MPVPFLMSLCYVYVSKTEKHSVACSYYVSDANEVFDLNGAPQIIQRQTQGVILALSFSCSTLHHMNTVFIIRGHRTTSYPSIVNAVAKERCQSSYWKSLPAGLSASLLDDHSSLFTV